MTKNLGYIVGVACLCASFVVNALPKKVVISDVMNESATVFLNIKSVLDAAYKELGVEVEWVRLPTTRALMYSNSGDFDGELIRIERVAKEYPNLVQVPVPLIETAFHLYCLKREHCVKSDLSSLLIGYNKQIKLYEHLCQQRKWACYSFVDSKRILAPLYQNKIEAFLAAGPELVVEINEPGPILYQSKALHKDTAFHYLHKKHKKLGEALAVTLNQQIKKGTTVVPLPIRFNTKSVSRVVPVTDSN